MILRLLSFVFLLLFLLAAAVQYNDPDRLVWIAMWLSPAVACFLHLRGKLPIWWPMAVAAVALAWAGTISGHVIGKVGFSDLFQEISMANPGIEYGREFYGLLIIAGWMIVLIVARKRRALA